MCRDVQKIEWVKGKYLSFIFLMINSVFAWADGSGVIDPFPTTGAYQATHRNNIGSLSVIEFAGNYDRYVSGNPNVEPRAVVAKAFLEQHADQYDFIVAFSTFDFDLGGEAAALHWGVQNKVQGIGLPEYDVSDLFGSAGVLQAYIDMGSIDQHVFDPLDPRFEEVLSLLGHEIMHQWSGRVRFDQGSGAETSLLGRDGSHWSNLLDTDASVLYGHQWKDNGDGRFTSTAIRKFFSPLDLYLAGLYEASEVAPITLLINPEVAANIESSQSLLTYGPTITATTRTINIGDIIAAEGPRIPSAANSPKQFRFAFVILAGQDEVVSEQAVGQINMLRRAFMDRFSVWTGGRAIAHVYPEGMPEFELGNPDEVEGGDLRETPSSLQEGFAWLRSQQSVEGFWQDKEKTLLRDTTVSLDVLSRLDSAFTRELEALDWLSAQDSKNTDYLARQAIVLAQLGRVQEAAAIRANLAARQNEDGGWGISASYQSNPLDTALVLDALHGHSDVVQGVINSASSYLLSQQNDDGGWGSIKHGPSRTSVTTTVLSILKQMNLHAGVSSNAIAWLVAKQNPDGGFGDSPSTNHDTANALKTIIDLDAIDQIRSSDASDYLLSQQSIEGSWNGSTYTTAVTLDALRKFSFPNWLLSNMTASATQLNDGDRVQLGITVRNDSNLATPAGTIRLYDGEPSGGGTPIGADIIVPVLVPGATITFRPYWDSFNLSGQHRLVAVVDPDAAVIEMSEQDNLASVDITVNAAPDGIDLSVIDQDISVIPNQPNTLPANLGFAATIRNLGANDAQNVSVRLLRGTEVVSEQFVNIPARSTVAVNFSYQLMQAGTVPFSLVLDGDNTIVEVSETNNVANASVQTQNSLDLRVNSIVSDTQTPLVGHDMTFTVELNNQGTNNSPSTQVRYLISDGNTTTEIQSNTVQINAGQNVQQTVVWRVDREADFTFTALIDPDNLIPELDEGNNTNSINFTAGQASGPNLAVDFNDFTFDPNPALEGSPLTLSALVRNTGADTANNIEVAFYNGDPNEGGALIGSDTIAQLNSNESSIATAVWSQVPDSLDKLLFVVVDPNNAIAEFSEQDNRAFNTLSVQSLVDLSLSSAEITLAPGFPHAGDAVTLSARVANLGQQAADDVVVRAFVGDPDNGGQQIGNDQSLNIPANDVAIYNITYTLGIDETQVSIYFQVDPDNSIAEQNEQNNTARRDFAVQDANFYVTERYISPDGDGVQDNTQFFFRLAAEQTVEIQLANESDDVVRRFSGGQLENTSGADVTWDGLDELGRLVADGRYRFQVKVANQIISEAVVYVDTNRSPLTASLGTPYASFKNLSCPIGRHEFFSVSNDDSTIHFSIPWVSGDETYLPGIYRMLGNGSDIQTIVPQSFFNQEQSNLPDTQAPLVVSDDGSKLAFFTHIFGTFPAEYKAWLIDGDGANLTELPRAISTDVLGFNHNNTALLTVETGQIYVEPLDASPKALLADIASHLNSTDVLISLTEFSPNQKQLLLDVYSFDNDRNYLLLLDSLSGDIVSISDDEEPLADRSWQASWAPNGLKFVVLEWGSFKAKVFDQAGNLISERPMPAVHHDPAGLSQNDGEAILNKPVWSSGSDEFAFIYYFDKRFSYQPPTFGVNNGGVYIHNLNTGNIEQVYQFKVSGAICSEICTTAFSGPAPNTSDFLWAPNERTLLLKSSAPDLKEGLEFELGMFDYEYYIDVSALWVLSEKEVFAPKAVFTNFAQVPSQLEFTKTGQQLLFNSLQENQNPDSVCVNSNDTWSFKSLFNLVAELHAVRSERIGGIVLSGTAADLHFDQYQLDYASVTTPNSWIAIQPVSNQPVINDVFTNWVPPQPGSYFVRLSVRDLAGNTRQTIKRISWSDTASITDLSRSNAIISPNGDDISDNTVIQYRVLEPVHLEFNIYNENGELVRTITRDHSVFGATFEFAWDGRDQNGILLADGQYTLTVQGYEFFVTIDSTLPLTSLQLNNAYQSVEVDGKSFVDVRPSLQWTVEDPHYFDSVIQTESTDDPNSTIELFDLDPAELGEGNLNERFLNVHQLPGQLFRLIAEDTAGNRGVKTVGPASEELMIAKFGPHRVYDDVQAAIDQLPLGANPADYPFIVDAVNQAGGFFTEINRAPYAAFNEVDGPNGSVIAGQGEVSFAVSETIAQDLAQLSVQYRLLTETQWTDAVLNQFYTEDLDQGSVSDTFIPERFEQLVPQLNHQLRAIWLPENINTDEVYAVRLRSLDENNQEYFSNTIRVVFSGGVAFRGLTSNATRDEWLTIISPLLRGQAQEAGEFILWGQEFIAAPVIDARLYISSDDDPRYAIEQELGISYGPNDGFIFRSKELTSCQVYRGYVVVTTANGTQTSSTLEFSTPCVDLRVIAEPDTAQSCNAASSGEVLFRFAPRSLDQRDLALLTLSPADDANDILFNVNQPDSVEFALDPAGQEYAYQFTLDVSAYEEGNRTFIAYLENVDGQSIEQIVPVLVDRTPPAVAITYPSESGLVCGVQRDLGAGQVNNVLTIEGSMQDANGMHYTVELVNGSVFTGEPELVHDSRRHDSFKAANNADPDILPPNTNYHLASLSGPLAEIFNRDGEYTARLSVYDQGGFKQCSDRTFVFDGKVDLGSVSVDHNVFSPNDDGRFDEVNFSYTLEENAILDIEIYAAELNEQDGALRIIGESLSTVVAQQSTLVGTGSTAWRGLDNSSTVLADGFYAALLRFTDACGNQTNRLLPITIDNTPPQINIEYPNTGDALQMVVEMLGTVTDQYFDHYIVEAGIGLAPTTWVRVNSGNEPVAITNVLARWNTFGLSGNHVLRVSSEDQIGNIATTLIPLLLDERVNLITYLEAIESHFSPNNDSRRESTSIRIGLDQASLLTVNVYDSNNTLRRQLLNAQAFGRGPVVVSWDGRDTNNTLLADGSYHISAIATLASNNAVEQNESITVVLDSTTPLVDIQRPNNGFVIGTGTVIGTIQDDYLTSFSVAIADNPVSPTWDTLLQGNSSVVDGNLGSINNLPEGDYVLRVIAIDKGDSRVEQIIPFTVDNTAPELRLLSPIENSVLGGASSPINILAELNETNPASYTLQYGLGAEPSSFIDIASSDVFPLAQPLAAWDVAGLQDGIHTLRLEVVDKAGLSASHQMVITVDNTLPNADITSPNANGFVTKALDIIGSANDENLKQYTLAIAPGSIGSSQQFSEIGAGSASVADAVLLNWQALPADGVYTLRLSVLDQANNSNEAFSEFTIDTQAPLAPSGLNATLTNEQAARLSWLANAESDLAGYHVYRAGIRITSNPITALTFEDNASNEGRIIYTITAVDQAGLESQRSEGVEIVVDNTAPTANITVPNTSSTVSGLVDIIGTAFSADDFKEYRIYTALSSSPESEQLIRRSPVPVQGSVLAQWNTIGLNEGDSYTLRLEAEDINGNVAESTSNVTIDNEAPAAPGGLSANVSGNDVELLWSANTESDLLGYLIYRNDQLANAGNTVIDDLRNFAVSESQYNDLSLPDGDYVYSVVAIDQAGNTSGSSNIANASLETRVPKANIVTPSNLSKFETPLYILAASDDNDIASVQFQYRAAGSTIWINLGAADTALPYEANLDPASLGLSLGDYELRAVATDNSNQTDPTPSMITVSYADLTRPAQVNGLNASVSGGDVELIWAANGESDLAGYHIDRVKDDDDSVRITTSPITENSFNDTGLDDGQYQYSLTAVDINGNESEASETVQADVYTPSLSSVMNPTIETSVSVEGKGIIAATVIAEVTRASGTQSLPQIETDLEGRFALADIALESGNNSLNISLLDAAGNLSKPALLILVRADRPSQPTGLSGSANNTDVNLQWNTNPENNIIAYRLLRNGENVLANSSVPATVASASNQSSSHPASAAVDGSNATYWDTLSPVEAQWLGIAWSEPQLISSISVHWFSNGTVAKDFNIDAWFEGQWIRLLELRNFESSGVEDTIALTQAYRTTQVRIQAVGSDYFRIAEFRANAVELINSTTYNGTEPDGEHGYSVIAVNEYGFQSVPSDSFQLAVGDITVPEAVVLDASVDNSNVNLTWTASSSPDLARYDVYRDNELIATITDLTTLSYSDNNRPNGTYRYNVHSVDTVGNENLSNAVDVTVLVAPPNAPIDLNIEVFDVGSSLGLTWSNDVGSTAEAFRVFRSEVSGGPYEAVGDVTESQFNDSNLVNGTTYFYVIAAIDVIGNLSELSSEASAIPEDRLAPEVPSIYSPTTPGTSYSTNQPLVDIAGGAEEGTAVSLMHNGFSVAEISTQNDTIVQRIENDAIQSQGRLSPSGKLYVYENFPSSEAELHLYNFDTNTTQLLTTVPHDYGLFPSWSNNGNDIIFTSRDNNTFNFIIQRYSVKDGTIETISDSQISDLMVGVLSPDGSKLAAIGYVESNSVSGEGVWLYDLETSQWTLLQQGGTYDFYETSLQWSPNGQYISYLNFSNSDNLEIVNIASGNVQVIDTQHSYNYSTVPRWSSDSNELLYVSQQSGSNQIWRYDISQGIASQITQAPGEYEMPQWSPDNKSISYIKLDNNALAIFDLGTQTETILETSNVWIDNAMEWLNTGYLLATVDNRINRYTFAGHFEFKAVPLTQGDNVFSVIATDDAGNASDASPSISVVYSLENNADLTISADDIRITPTVPNLNQVAAVSLMVRNIGQSTSEASNISLVAIDPLEQRINLLDQVLLNPIALNGSQTVSASWPVGLSEGAYRLVAVVDANNQVLEASESNNTAIRNVFISGSSLPELSLSADKQGYQSNQEANFSVNMTNRGEEFNGRLQILIEDSAGYLVQALSSENINNFAYANTLSRTVQWNTGSTFAGNYQLVARLYDQQDRLLVSESLSFIISEATLLTSGLQLDRSIYSPSDTANITATIDYPDGNAVLSNINAQVRVSNIVGDIVFEDIKALNSVIPGSSNALNYGWLIGSNLSTGEYTVSLSVFNSESTLSEANTTLNIVSSTEIQLQGTLQLSSSDINVGDSIAVSYTMSNQGSAVVSNLPVSVSIIDPDNLTVIKNNLTEIVSLPVGTQTNQTVSFDQGFLLLKTYTIILKANIGVGVDQWITLDSGSFSITDQIQPVIEIYAPTQAGFINGAATSRVRVLDNHSFISSVEASVDNGDWQALTRLSTSENIYGNLLPDLSEGTHTYQVRATDAAGNISITDVVTFEVDNQAPTILIEGVVNDLLTDQVITPVITIEDLYLSETSITLNGSDYISGTPITETGLYNLYVSARDQAGNLAERFVLFAIDVTAPDISVMGVEDGDIRNDDVTIDISIFEANLTNQSILLNGLPYESGTVITEDGEYQLVVTAEDYFSRVSTMTVDFVIDKTQPVIVIVSPNHNAEVTSANIDIVGETEAYATVMLQSENTDPVSVFSDQDGQFTFSSVALLDGINDFTLTAEDQAGNAGEEVLLSVNRISAVQIELEGQLLGNSGVLVWLAKENSLMEGLLNDAFDANSVDHMIVYKESDFIKQLRTRRYGTVLLSDDPNDNHHHGHEHHHKYGKYHCHYNNRRHHKGLNISYRVKNEIRPMVAAGLGLIYFKTHAYNSMSMSDIFGAKVTGRLININQLELDDTPLTSAALLNINGQSTLRLKAKGGLAIGKFLPADKPAMIANQYIDGRAVLAGFHLTDLGDHSAATTVIADILNHVRPEHASLTAYSSNQVQWQASGFNAAVGVRFEQTLPNNMSFISVDEDAVINDEQNAVWHRQVITETSLFNANVTMPANTGISTISGRIYHDEAGVLTLLAESDLPVNIDISQENLEASILSALEGLQVHHYDRYKKKKALRFTKYAVNLGKQNKKELDWAIAYIRSAYWWLNKMSSEYPDIKRSLGQLLCIYQSLWSNQEDIDVPPELYFIKPYHDRHVDDEAWIKWVDKDPDSNATISLYYDTDMTGADGMLIASDIEENKDGYHDMYEWEIDGDMAAGKYYIYAIISDNTNSQVVYAPGAFIVEGDDD